MRTPVRSIALSLGLFAAISIAPRAGFAQTDQTYQQQYPQQQYPQQQYPQQQYPQQQYPQQQYPQQQYPQQQYPQQGYYGAPPPAAAPVAGTPSYPPPAQPVYMPPPAEPAFRRGFLWMPYLGVNVPVGSGSDAYSTGFRLGALFGINLGQPLSLNAELNIDVLNPDSSRILNPYTSETATSATDVAVDLAFSPLFHIDLPALELVIGPKLGYFGEGITNSFSSGDLSYSANGVTYGLNAGVFVPLGRIALGGLLNFTARHYDTYCENDYRTGYVDVCGNVSGGTDSKIFGVSFAMMY